jgi:hypothetical protein
MSRTLFPASRSMLFLAEKQKTHGERVYLLDSLGMAPLTRICGFVT